MFEKLFSTYKLKLNSKTIFIFLAKKKETSIKKAYFYT